MEGAAAVIAQVEDNPVHILLAQLHQQFIDIPGGTFIFRVSLSIGFKVHIEGGDIYNTQAQGRAVLLNIYNFALGRFLLQFYLVTDDGNNLRAICGVTGTVDHFKSDRGILGPANQLHHIIQAPADHVHQLLIFLSNTDNLVFCFEHTLQVCGTAGNHPRHLCVFVLSGQLGSDTLEGEGHIDLEILRGAR